MKAETILVKGKTYDLYRVQTLVVGSGAAGLNAAVSLYKGGQKDIAILTEGVGMGTSLNTGSDKQTYYKLTTCGAEPDSVRKMAATLFDGQSMDGDLALIEAALSLRGFYHLVDIGVPFPCNGFGEYVGYKTDHDPNQRGTSAGPLTSKFMTEQLWKEVKSDGIEVFDGYQVIELLTEGEDGEKRVRGLAALNVKEQEADRQYTVFAADNIVYAVGGEAGMYQTSVYPVSQTGGMGTAFRAGARGKNLTESQYGIASIKFRWNLSGTYQQVLPRYVSTAQDGSDECEFLEAYFPNKEDLLFAIFLKGYQWPFDPRKTLNYGSSLIDLLVYQETVLKGRRVFLDYQKNPVSAEKDGAFEPALLNEEAHEYLKNSDGLHETPISRLEHMNPAAIELYRSHGIDLHTELLEIAVCAQHNNGGLAGNIWWESNLKHLFPVGEVNGTHGVYRPGGSALNSGQVGSTRAAQFIANRYTEGAWDAEVVSAKLGEQIDRACSFGRDAVESATAVCAGAADDLEQRGSEKDTFDWKEERRELGARMSTYGANIRSLQGVDAALKENHRQLEQLKNKKIAKAADMKHYYRTRDLLVSQRIYLEAIRDYIEHGGTSRGSYLIYDESGTKPLEQLPDEFCFSLEEKGLGQEIQEIAYDEASDSTKTSWRPIRPIPEEDSWFEKVWKDYREGRYFA